MKINEGRNQNGKKELPEHGKHQKVKKGILKPE